MLADLVVVIHLVYFVFVVGGFFYIVFGARKQWPSIRNPWFRTSHLAAVFIVLVEDTFGWNCPLNVAETSLRASTPDPPGPVGGFLDFLLHQTLTERTLDAIYWTLGGALLLLFIIVKPDFHIRRRTVSPGRPA